MVYPPFSSRAKEVSVKIRFWVVSIVRLVPFYVVRGYEVAPLATLAVNRDVTVLAILASHDFLAREPMSLVLVYTIDVLAHALTPNSRMQSSIVQYLPSMTYSTLIISIPLLLAVNTKFHINSRNLSFSIFNISIFSRRDREV